jgi:RNase P subunit RPR2
MDDKGALAPARKRMLCWRCNGPALLTDVRLRPPSEGGGQEASYRCEDCGTVLKRTLAAEKDPRG